ncbi:hypothetical protein MSAN_01023200 [Mycena sanguinolenta]|uniref:F-box domain-containing protein n=1 Tax=Mycena sanguinolenta TaxID=230812 RepID=A0A8H6YR60_9AGAR|nr:hypothetical protein MSAN_01023200 [Mycena sanguinolenta]
MAALFDLPNELLNLILLSLLYHDRDLETLTSLSLASRQLRSIVEPVTKQYLCLQGHFGSRHPSESPDTREAAFLDFFSDDARAAAVRYLKLTGHVEITGIELLTRLRNVAYLEISGAWADQQDQPDCFHMVYTLVGRFPTLRTVYLKNCYQEDEDFDEFRDDLKDDPYENMVPNAHVPSGIISTSLRHIICENVDPAFRKLWLSMPEIEVVEMHMCEFKPWENTSRNTGAYRMLLRDPVFCGKVKCFRIENRLVDEDDEYEQEWRLYSTRDAVNIHSFFQWRAQVLPCLQELILELPFHAKHIPDILAALPELCPSLKVFKFELSPRGYNDFIYSGQKFPLPSSKEFQFLEEAFFYTLETEGSEESRWRLNESLKT